MRLRMEMIRRHAEANSDPFPTGAGSEAANFVDQAGAVYPDGRTRMSLSLSRQIDPFTRAS
jgi:hypothetical protein